MALPAAARQQPVTHLPVRAPQARLPVVLVRRRHSFARVQSTLTRTGRVVVCEPLRGPWGTTRRTMAAASEPVGEVGTAPCEGAASSDPGGPADGSAKPRLFVLLHGVAKSTNVGNIMRSASAFDAEHLLVVGGGHKKKLATFGSQGTERFVSVKRFSALEEAVEWVHSEGGRVVGVEITPDAKPITDPDAFTGTTALFMGEEGHGLNERQKTLCDSFVYIPQYGVGTASLNVSVAAGIAMHRFACFAQFRERVRDPAHDKFLVDAPPDRSKLPRTEEELALSEARERAREQNATLAAHVEIPEWFSDQ
jgi:tRNA G18 (ribose-2'-O)-methylase SpoU